MADPVDFPLLPTPNAEMGKHGSTHPDKRKGHQVSLSDAVCFGTENKLLPTPQAFDRVDHVRSPEKLAETQGGCRNLREVVVNELFPTPTAQDAANNAGPAQYRRNTPPLNAVAVELLPTPSATEGNRGGGQVDDARRQGHQVKLIDMAPSLDAISHYLPTPTAGDEGGGMRTVSDGEGGRRPVEWDDVTKPTGEGGASRLWDVAGLVDVQWGRYEAAIRRWEGITRPAPLPTEPNKNGNPRLSAEFSEWMMGWPKGWVTDPEIGITRSQQLRIVGNGVVSLQAVAALEQLLESMLESRREVT